MSYEGKVVLNYKLTKKLGEGGFGAVYLAEQVDLGRRAAIKVLHHQFSAQPQVVERFFREARAVCEIGHRAIVAVENFGRLDTGEPFYLMEFFAGGSLTQITSERWLTSEQLVAILDPVADALSAAHAKGIIHRDLKPDNIMVRIANDKVADVRLLDFGIAKLLDGDSHSMTGSAMGTPSYMPPEQALDAKNVDVRADVYSFGATIYAAVCGRPPFDGSSVAAILLAVQQQTAELLSSRRADVTPALDAAIRRCLAKSRDHRPPSIADAWSAIRAEIVRAHLSSTPASPNPAHASLVTPQPMGVVTPPAHVPPAASPQVAPAVATPVPGTIEAIDHAPATSPEIARPSKKPLVIAGVGLLAVGGIVAAVIAAGGSKSTADPGGSGSVASAVPDAAVVSPPPDVATTTPDLVTPPRLTEQDVRGPFTTAATALFATCGAKPGAPTKPVLFRIDVTAEGTLQFVEIDGATTPIAECVKKALKTKGPRFQTSLSGGGFGISLEVPEGKPATTPKPPDPKPPDPKPDPKPPDPKPACSESYFTSVASTGKKVDVLTAIEKLNGCERTLGTPTYTRLKQALVRRSLEVE